MDIKKINSEISSKALSEIATEIHGAVKDMNRDPHSQRTAAITIAGCKHLLQALALDWMYNKKKAIEA